METHPGIVKRSKSLGRESESRRMYAFGSSTPRDLSHLNLPFRYRVYNTRLQDALYSAPSTIRQAQRSVTSPKRLAASRSSASPQRRKPLVQRTPLVKPKDSSKPTQSSRPESATTFTAPVSTATPPLTSPKGPPSAPSEPAVESDPPEARPDDMDSGIQESFEGGESDTAPHKVSPEGTEKEEAGTPVASAEDECNVCEPCDLVRSVEIENYEANDEGERENEENDDIKSVEVVADDRDDESEEPMSVEDEHHGRKENKTSANEENNEEDEKESRRKDKAEEKTRPHDEADEPMSVEDEADAKSKNEENEDHDENNARTSGRILGNEEKEHPHDENEENEAEGSPSERKSPTDEKNESDKENEAENEEEGLAEKVQDLAEKAEDMLEDAAQSIQDSAVAAAKYGADLVGKLTGSKSDEEEAESPDQGSNNEDSIMKDSLVDKSAPAPDSASSGRLAISPGNVQLTEAGQPAMESGQEIIILEEEEARLKLTDADFKRAENTKLEDAALVQKVSVIEASSEFQPNTTLNTESDLKAEAASPDEKSCSSTSTM